MSCQIVVINCPIVNQKLMGRSELISALIDMDSSKYCVNLSLSSRCLASGERDKQGRSKLVVELDCGAPTEVDVLIKGTVVVIER